MEGASQKAAVLLFGLLLVLIFQACNANICNVPVSDLMACKLAVTVSRSGTPPPSAKCCEVISRADLRCLCSHKNSKFLPLLGVDPYLAFQLPAKCRIPNAPQC
ncbi:hypothetical protein RHSIM_Rhsim12G0036600 [Rhododendron simsii]|uniref:Bifunctional inhibitor/plant lipid transfer protein/seed storage helical domain-containing protein n=1 Tax=Rhododendron simsii TaxID=118357 RepID=A0A834G172_RHOSS|nr:hypothetical protein RHSIM_Rhsim12G0036600 [Rhododendron simsii]